MSQLSVAIFIAPRTHFPAQESLIYQKKSVFLGNPYQSPPCLVNCAIYRAVQETGGGVCAGLVVFGTFFTKLTISEPRNVFWKL